MREKLIKANQAEKEYLKARRGKCDDALAAVEEIFFAKLREAGFQSVDDYYDNVRNYGHRWRTLTFGRYNTADQITYGIDEAYATGNDIIAYTIFDHTMAVLPDVKDAESLVDVDYCQNHGVEIVSHGAGETGCYVAEAGNVGVLLVLHRPCYARAMELELKKVIQNVLLNHYGVTTYLDKNEIMTRHFPQHPDGVKIWGDAQADIGRVSMAVGGLTLEFHKEEAERILKLRPDHPTLKEPHGLNHLLGYKINPGQCLIFIIEEWLKQTESQVTDRKWRTRFSDQLRTAT